MGQSVFNLNADLQHPKTDVNVTDARNTILQFLDFDIYSREFTPSGIQISPLPEGKNTPIKFPTIFPKI